MIWLSAVILVLSNLSPLYGVSVLGWSLALILFFYWSETAVIGFFTVLKASKIEGDAERRFVDLGLFVCKFGLFMTVHLSVLTSIFAEIDPQGASILNDPVSLFNEIKYFYGFLFLAHGAAFYQYMKNKEYLQAEIDTLTKAAFNRVVYMQILIALGAYAMALFPSRDPFVFMTAAVILKTATDLKAQLDAHRLLQKP